MRMVAAVQQWRTMTTEQLEAFTDVPGVDVTATQPWLSTLWAADLVDYAVAGQTLGKSWRTAPARLVRPTRPGAGTERFTDMLSWAEWVSVTGGYGMEP
ncbi:MAG: hypothetical protein B7X32_18170, partial [Microbacterium sp. 13-71-7]